MKLTLRQLPLMLLFCLGINFSVQAQKKPLTHEVYDDWKSIHASLISNDGQHMLYVVNPALGDGNLHVRDIQQGKEQIYARGANPSFTYDSRYAIFLVQPQYDSVHQAKLKKAKEEALPKDSLVVLNLNNQQIYRHERVQSYKLPEKAGGWVAFLMEAPLPEKDSTEADSTSAEDTLFAIQADDKDKDKPKGSELVLLKLESGEEQRFKGVKEYLFAENSSKLLFSTVKDSTQSAGVFAFDTENEELSVLDSGKVSYQHLAMSKDGLRAAFLASEDSLKAEERYFTLYLYDSTLLLVADTLSEGVPEGWMVSENEAPFFSEDANKLFFGTAPRPEKYAYEEDTTLLEEERVKVDIWTWKDPLIQPMQKLQAEDEMKRDYMAMYNISLQQLTQLADEEVPDIHFDVEKRLPYALGYSELPYQQQMSWDYPFHRDVYLVDLERGERTQIVTNTSGYPELSPAAKYVYWYEAADSSWHAYEISSGQTINLTEEIDANFYDETHDSPSLPGGYGSAGWTEGDEHFLVYDYYDIWKVNPKTREATNLTDGYGRKNEIALRYQQLDPEAYFIPASDEILLEAFHRTDKQSGFYKEHTSRSRTPQLLVMDDYAFSFDQKAKNSNDLLFRKSSFTEFPDLWHSTLEFNNPKKISDANPQQKDYLWGSVELLSWQSADGIPLQGMLYKPENFDPAQKYPMLVYFYERYSDNLHRHLAPEPHRSTINFTFYTSRGYLVFVPDIVYKKGYPGESALNAVVSGTLHVSQQDFVDKERIGLQGHSWGGYQVAYIVTRSNMFRAAEAGAPVVNMTSAYGGIRWGTGMSRMFQYERTQSRIGGSLWEYPLRYIENSPLFFADKIETPLLILHNDEDGAVPWEQGIEFFMALRRLGKPAWMLNYNGEPHWPLKYQNRKDFARRMQQFFDYYLKDEPMPEWMKEGIPATLKGRTLRYELSEE
ncbi:S9 family peptidase [Catalinimonas niigatensis]|uniref:S9 family peptidase n=1 Tax=Catalinimonas niigatensis TaxID=1397264 RepID=UPI002664EDB6|nr:prolyl oligopeptidase family serine peptidase [Catalinimonas niigatensis]WPP50482.1 prolyl oligopeptidase family serine peptidase [Catalinimonas niigatensis]